MFSFCFRAEAPASLNGVTEDEFAEPEAAKDEGGLRSDGFYEVNENASVFSESFQSEFDSNEDSDYCAAADDDEFFDAVSQQLYNSTLILDYNQNEQSTDE